MTTPKRAGARAKTLRRGQRITLEAAQVEFTSGGNTLWVHGPSGATILRLKVTGRIIAAKCETSPVPHGDAVIDGDLAICIPGKPHPSGGAV